MYILLFHTTLTYCMDIHMMLLTSIQQTYNCGRSEDIFEFAARWAGYSPQNKGVVYYSASGGGPFDACPPASEHPAYCDETWRPTNHSGNEFIIFIVAI